MPRLLLFLFFCGFISTAQAQQRLAAARQSSYLTKVFRLSEAQTRHLYKRGLSAARPDFFAVPVDSFPTDSLRPRPLPPGYYLVAHTEGAQLVYWLRTETNLTVEVLSNQVDLALVVRDSLGRLLPTARVELGSRPVPFDAATGTYRRARRGHAGLLAVTYGGRTTFHALEQPRQGLRSLGGRVWRRVVVGWPLGYATGPLYQLGRDLGHASRANTGILGLLRSPFDEDVRDERQRTRRYRRQQRWASYLVLSQPRYRPTADTLRLKARVLRRRTGRPYRGPLTLWLSGRGDDKRLAELRPVRPGSYEYVLPLADTLGLRADSYTSVKLKDARGTELASNSFRVEDYELDNAHYALRVAEKTPRHGQPQAVYLRGTDANELPLLNARVRLAVVPQREPGPLPRQQVFIADTLWTRTQALDPVGETRINLPAGIFPDVNFGYAVQATFLTADNERHLETTSVAYQRDPGRLLLTLSADSVRLAYDSLGVAQPHPATLHLDGDDGEQPGRAATPPRAVQLPLRVPLDFLTATYRLTDAAGRSASLDLDAGNAGLSLRSDRPADSVLLAVDNPHQVPFWYFVYRGNALRYRGYGTAYQLKIKDKSAASWHVSLHYRWGAALRTAEYTVGLPPRQLLVATDQPAVAYPGQKIKLGFTVTDERGRPVPDADLTAYAYNHKFGAPNLPAVSALARPVLGRAARRRFKLGVGFDQDAKARQPLRWARWRTQLGLDSLQFYRFLYPETGFFQEYRPAPGGLTQVAPFVVDSGRVQAPIAVYVDGQPSYIQDINEHSPYALVADSGRHTLSWRLPERLITLRNVYLRPQHKLTLSIDPNHPSPELTVEKRPRQLAPAEQLTLSRTVLLVDEPRSAAFTALRQGPLLRVLSGYGPGSRQAGPFRPDSVLLRRADGLRLKFLFEPLFAYSPQARLLKMVAVPPARFGQLDGSGLPSRLPLADFALTEANIRPLLYPAPFAPEAELNEPTQTLPGQGRLALRLPPRPDTARHPLPTLRYVLLTRPDQPKYLRLSQQHRLLALAPGRYRVAVLLSDSTCLAPAELARVQADGQLYFQLRWADRQPAGALSRRIGQLVRARYIRVTREPAPTPPARPVSAPPLQLGLPRPDWRTLRGQVLDAETEEGLPGVTVMVKGTDVGTATGVDGSFALQVPPNRLVISVSSVGYTSIEQEITYASNFVFKLRTDARQLDEVVVVGYGIQSQRREITGAVASIEYGLQGRVAGLQITSGSGYIHSGITLRGTRSVTGGEQALLVVDGRVYTGNLADISPDNIANVTVLKDAEATAAYGSRAANGVLIITTKGSPDLGKLRPLPALAPPTLPDVPVGDPRLALRRRFRDYAWWRPTLVTDAQGRATTDVVLPDDVTNWDTFVIGSDGHRRTGAATGRLRSFKGLLAELAGPRFLVAGDRAQVLGKVMNYRTDTAQVTTTFKVGAQVVRSQARRVGTSVVDTLTVTAPAAGADSVQVTFGLVQAGGYADGEQRSLPVLPAGTREQLGTFAAITAADTTLTLPLDPKLGEVTVHLDSDALPALLAEIRHVQAYAYLCHEQLASKLLALLLEQRIRAARGEEFRGQRAVQALIRKLQQGRQPAALWGTWPGAAPSVWVSAHALEALLAAEKAGFKIDLDKPQLQARLLRELDERLSTPAPPVALAAQRRGVAVPPTPPSPDADEALRLLRVLHQLGTTTDYRTYLDRLDRAQPGRRALDRYLASVELRQQLSLPYQLDSLRRYRLRTALGGAFYADTAGRNTYFRYLLPDRVGTTLLAYRVLRAQGGHAAELARIRTFLLGLRGGSYWGSTYEAAQILATIGPDLLGPGGQAAPAQVRLAGAPAAEAAGIISRFPFDLKLPATGALTLRKTGALPVYASAYQTRWNSAPEAVAKPFTVTTTLAGQAGRRLSLRAGQPAELVVTVEVQAEARYVLLEVPIPAGCSYGPAPTRNSLETHRENLRHQAGIFIDYLPVGRHTFRVAVQPRYRGQYTLNPARAGLVYFPTKYGRTGSKQVGIQ
jgi:TonB-dependent SusC/RagA subfamily outer membrane receptor